MSPPRIVKENDGFVARSDEYPNIVGRGDLEADAVADFKKKLLDEEVREAASDYEDWDGRSDDQRRWDD